MNQYLPRKDEVDGLPLRIGLGALLLTILLGLLPGWHTPFFRAYLFAWLFWLGISLGSMGFTMLHTLTGGAWGVLIRPITAAAARVLVVLFFLFIPVLFGFTNLFPWARSQTLALDAVIAHESVYLNRTWFILRYLFYFAVWISLTWRVTGNFGYERGRSSAGGIVFYIVSMTLASVDWIMSREPHFVSSIFGFLFVVGQTLSALCFTILILRTRISKPEVQRFIKPSHLIDIGNLVLTLVILWAYMNFAQFLIIWMGNEQSDSGWYVQRTYAGWRIVAGIMIFLHFAVPFLFLLFRNLKRRIIPLATLAGYLLLLRVLDLYWIVGPLDRAGAHHSGFSVSPLDFLALLGIGGIWYAGFNYFLLRMPLLAMREETEVHGHTVPQTR